MQEETSKEAGYQETIKKQENIMSRLEGLLERSVSSKDKARSSTYELDKLKKEIDFLQS